MRFVCFAEIMEGYRHRYPVSEDVLKRNERADVSLSYSGKMHGLRKSQVHSELSLSFRLGRRWLRLVARLLVPSDNECVCLFELLDRNGQLFVATALLIGLRRDWTDSCGFRRGCLSIHYHRFCWLQQGRSRLAGVKSSRRIDLTGSLGVCRCLFHRCLRINGSSGQC
jgi:hypothetical protein